MEWHEAFEVQTFKFYIITVNTFKLMTVNADKNLTLQSKTLMNHKLLAIFVKYYFIMPAIVHSQGG
jgi:hypothetical protein